MQIGTAQNDAFLAMLGGLSQEAWATPTECAPWTVKDVAAHVLGEAEGYASLRELRRQASMSKKRKAEFGNRVNALNQIQVDDRAHLSTAELLTRLGTALPKFIARRELLGRAGKVVPFYDPSIIGFANVRYLMDTVYARDVFMHRADVCRALGREFESIPEDKALISDVVRDWARRARPDMRLELEGPGGGSFEMGSGATTVTIDAVDFCRIMSGRIPSEPLSIEGDEATARTALEVGCPF